jgi:hypothetical protein
MRLPSVNPASLTHIGDCNRHSAGLLRLAIIQGTTLDAAAAEGSPLSSPFDPNRHVRQLEDGSEHLDLKWQLFWLRSEHPDAQLETELIRIDDEGAVCKATIRLSDGGSSTAHAMANHSPQGGHVEQAEARALGRALASLGFGAEFLEVDRLPLRAVSTETRGATAPTPLPSRPRPVIQEAPPAPGYRDEDDDGRHPAAPAAPRQPAEPQSTDQETQPQASADMESDSAPEPLPPMQRGTETTEISWNKFWQWAKRRGYRDQAHLRELLGVDILSLTPTEVQGLLRRYELDHPPPGSDE